LILAEGVHGTGAASVQQRLPAAREVGRELVAPEQRRGSRLHGRGKAGHRPRAWRLAAEQMGGRFRAP